MQPLTPQEADQATNALTAAIQGAATTGGQQNEAAVSALAPGLAVGSNAPGGYNYNRLVAPTVDPLADEMVLATKQALLRQSLKDSEYVAKTAYEGASQGLQQRQYDFNKKQKLEADERQRKADERQAKYDREAEEERQLRLASYRSASSGGGGGSSGGGGGGGGGGGTVGTTQTTARAGTPTMRQRGDGGYNFTDANGRAISAATYARLVGVNLAQLVNAMANSGDKGARAAMSGPGLNTKAASYKALTW